MLILHLNFKIVIFNNLIEFLCVKLYTENLMFLNIIIDGVLLMKFSTLSSQENSMTNSHLQSTNVVSW